MDSEQFEHFLQEHEGDIYNFCRHLAADLEIAAELYQETALAAFEMRGKIDADNNPKSLLLSIAAGKWKNMRRKAARRMAIAPQVSEENAISAGGGESPEDTAMRNHVNAAIKNALANVNDKFRVPLILHYFDDMQTEEIGRVLGIPQGTVKSRLHKGRQILKKFLEKGGFPHE
jgi:RNA polymerase sigma-70 factor (ECF subfamily)